MKRSLVGILSLVSLFAVEARADLIPGRPPVRPGVAREVKLQVQIDPKVRSPQLYIPANLMQGGQGAVPPRRFGAAEFSTVVIGLALAGAFISGGWWLSRRGGRRGPIAAAIALVCLGVGGVLFADIAIPPRLGKVETVKLPANVMLPDKVTIQIGPAGSAIRLVLPPPPRRRPGAGAAPRAVPPAEQASKPDRPGK